MLVVVYSTMTVAQWHSAGPQGRRQSAPVATATDHAREEASGTATTLSMNGHKTLEERPHNSQGKATTLRGTATRLLRKGHNTSRSGHKTIEERPQHLKEQQQDSRGKATTLSRSDHKTLEERPQDS